MKRNNQQSAIEPLHFQSSPSAYPDLTRTIYRTCPVCSGCSFEEAKQFTNLDLCPEHDAMQKRKNAKAWQNDLDDMNEKILDDEARYEVYERRLAAQRN